MVVHNIGLVKNNFIAEIHYKLDSENVQTEMTDDDDENDDGDDSDDDNEDDDDKDENGIKKDDVNDNNDYDNKEDDTDDDDTDDDDTDDMTMKMTMIMIFDPRPWSMFAKKFFCWCNALNPSTSGT